MHIDIPHYYTWDRKSWHRQKEGRSVEGYPGVKETQVLGRVYTISPCQGEFFYLHLLLHGPWSFANLKVMDGDICA